MVMQGRSWK